MSTNTAELVSLEIPARPAFVGVARTVVVSVAASVSGISDDRLEDLRIAVSEACTNAVENHVADSCDHRVLVRCVVDDDQLEIRLEDSVGGLDAGSLAEPRDVEAEHRDDGDTGWGLQLIRALVDDVRFDRSGSRTSVHLVVQRDAGD